jgi:hypothetical protein
MSLGWVIAGTFAQGMLGMWLFMMAAFAGGGMANGNSLSKGQTRLLDLGLIAVPAACAVSAVAVIYLYITDASAAAYWWYAVPVVFGAAYFWYATQLLPRQIAAANAANAANAAEAPAHAARPSAADKKPGRKKRPRR